MRSRPRSRICSLARPWAALNRHFSRLKTLHVLSNHQIRADSPAPTALQAGRARILQDRSSCEWYDRWRT